MDLKQGDVVAVAFPYQLGGMVARRREDVQPIADEKPASIRPAVVVSGRKLRDDASKFYVAMITKATHPGVPGDFVIQDLVLAGLNIVSKVRPTKIATLDSRAIVRKLGQLSTSETEVVVARVRQFLTR
jgi:mRNA interferase MazF